MQDRGLGAQRLQVAPVDVEDAVHLLERLAAVPVHQAQARQEGAGTRQLRVGGEGPLQCRHRIAAAFEARDAGQAEERPRVGRVLREDFLEGGRCLGGVVAFQEELGDGEPGGVVQGPGGDGFVQGGQGVVGVLVVPAGKVDERAPHRREFGRHEAGRAVVVVDEAVEEAAGDVTVAVAVLQDPQSDPRQRPRHPALPGPRHERGPRLAHTAQVHQRGPEERARPGHPALHPPFGRLNGVFVVALLAQRGDPPGQRGGVPVEGLLA